MGTTVVGEASESLAKSWANFVMGVGLISIFRCVAELIG